MQEAVDASDGRVTIAMDNCPHQVVLVGDEEGMDIVMQSLQGRGGLCQRIPWNRPYHTEVCAPLCSIVEEYLDGLRIRPPKIEFWSCATAARMSPDADEVKRLASLQWKSRVRFRETIEAMHDEGYRVFIEVGPRNVLSSFIDDTLGDRPHVAVPMDVQQKDGIEQLCRAIGMLAAHGVDIDLDPLFQRRGAEHLDFSVDLPAMAEPDPVLPLELPQFDLDGEALETARTMFGGGGAPPDRGVEPSMPDPTTHRATAPQPAAAADRERVFVEFQQTMQQFLDMQRDLMVPGQTGNGDGPTAAAGAAAAAVLTEPAVASPEAAPEPTGAFLDRVVETVPGRRMVAEAEFVTERHTFLLDHAFFGRGVSVTDPGLHCLPVMPLVVSLELLAEAATMLLPGRRVGAITEIEIIGWVAFDTPSRRVRVAAELIAPDRVAARLYEAGDSARESTLVSATVELSAGAADLGEPAVPDVAGESPPWPGMTRSTDGFSITGPRFRASSMSRHGVPRESGRW